LVKSNVTENGKVKVRGGKMEGGEGLEEGKRGGNRRGVDGSEERRKKGRGGDKTGEGSVYTYLRPCGE